MTPQPRYKLPKSQRLTGRTTFDLLYAAGKKRSSHPLLSFAARRADDGPSRMGISVGRKCGNAVIRNLMKRRLREAYRLMQHELPIGTNWLLIVRPHDPLEVRQYQEKLRNLLREGIVLDQLTAPKSAPRRGKGKSDAGTHRRGDAKKP